MNKTSMCYFTFKFKNHQINIKSRKYHDMKIGFVTNEGGKNQTSMITQGIKKYHQILDVIIENPRRLSLKSM